MALTKTPICDFGQKAPDFYLRATDGQYYGLKECAGEKGILIMFICNHCPYVKAILARLIEDVKVLKAAGIGCVGICSNDPTDYPEDSYESMRQLANEKNFPFPYLVDETQAIARAYGAVCTPDFFGYNANFELQYRGRLDESGIHPAPAHAKRELVEAMQLVAATKQGPRDQVASQGCSIKWRA